MGVLLIHYHHKACCRGWWGGDLCVNVCARSHAWMISHDWGGSRDPYQKQLLGILAMGYGLLFREGFLSELRGGSSPCYPVETEVLPFPPPSSSLTSLAPSGVPHSMLALKAGLMRLSLGTPG